MHVYFCKSYILCSGLKLILNNMFFICYTYADSKYYITYYNIKSSEFFSSTTFIKTAEKMCTFLPLLLINYLNKDGICFGK